MTTSTDATQTGRIAMSENSYLAVIRWFRERYYAAKAKYEAFEKDGKYPCTFDHPDFEPYCRAVHEACVVMDDWHAFANEFDGVRS